MSSTSHQDPQTTPPANVTEILNDAAAGVIDSGRLVELTDLSRPQILEFLGVWEGLPIQVRWDIVRELVRLGTTELSTNFTRIFRALVSDPDAEIRALAISGLWEDLSASYLHDLCALAMSEREPAVQEAIAVALGAFSFEDVTNERSTFPTVELKNALKFLEANGSNWMVRRRALEALAYFPDDSDVHLLIEKAANADFEQERAGALVAMGHNLDRRWYPIVLKELDNEDPDVRCEAARASGEFEDPSAIDLLARLVDDEDDEIRRVAVEAIGKIGGRHAVEALRYLRTQVADDLQDSIDDAIQEAQFWLDEG